MSNNNKVHPINTGSYKLQFDGCSKSNPGQGGAGAVIYNNDTEYWGSSKFVGDKVTNNYAEYTALIMGLESALYMDITDLLVEGDSLLVINQMTGKYKCHSSNLLPLYNKANELKAKFNYIEFQHIYRRLNVRADELANIAITK